MHPSQDLTHPSAKPTLDTGEDHGVEYTDSHFPN